MEKGASNVLAGKVPVKKGKGKLREMAIRHGHAGGFIVKHHVDHEDAGSEMQEYPLADKKQLMAHIQQHAQEEQAEMAGGEGAPEVAAEDRE